jgi:GNAT superfamily N-acetyltransferase
MNKADLKIDHYAGIDGTPAVAIALRGQLECLEYGGEVAIGLHYSYNAIVASIGAETIGVIVWHEQKEWRRIWLQLGYVLPEYRREGIYSVLWEELLAKAYELKVDAICSATAAANERMRTIAKKQGRVEYAVSLRYRLPALQVDPETRR